MLEKTGTDKKLDPRVRRTRQWLQEALLALLAEKSFQAITVQDIAERAQVNRVTFYAHFEDKDALLEHTLREAFRQRLRAQLPEDTPFSADNLQRLIVMVCDYLAEMMVHCPPPHRQFEPLMEKQVKAEVYEVLLKWRLGLPAAHPRQATPPELAAQLTSWAIYGAATQWGQQAKPGKVEDFAREVARLILPGFQPRPLPAALP